MMISKFLAKKLISFESKGWTPENFKWKHGSSIAMEKKLPFLDPFQGFLF